MWRRRLKECCLKTRLEGRCELKVYAGNEHPHAAQKPEKIGNKGIGGEQMAEQFMAVGRRKKSIARVILRPEKGGFTINKRDIDDYLGWKH